MPLPALSLLVRFAIFLAAAAAALAGGMVLCKSPSEAVHLAAVPGFASYALLFRPDIVRRIRLRHVLYFAALTAAVAAYLAAFSRVSTMMKVRWSELPLAVYFLMAVHVVVWLIDRLINMTLSAAFLLHRDARRPLARYLPKTLLRVLLFVAVVTPYLTGTFLTHWVKFADGVDPAEFLGAAYERLNLQASDGLRVEAWFIPAVEGASDATVILVPGRGLTKSCYLSYARLLRNNDYNVLLLDPRGEGGSEGHTRSFGVLEARDVLGAVQYLKQCRPAASKYVFAYGLASGASAVISAAGSDLQIQGVVADGASARVEASLEGLPPLPAPLNGWLRQATLLVASLELGCNLFQAGAIHDVGRISPRPLLLIHGKSDSDTPMSQAEALLAAAGSQTVLLKVPHAGSEQSMLHGGSEYTAQVLAVFKSVRMHWPFGQR